MKKQYIKHIIISLLAMCSLSTFAQQVSTLYFMDNIAERNAYNPAFQPITNYFDIPFFPNLRAEVGNNSLVFKDLVKSQTINDASGNPVDSTITFLHPQANKDDFYKTLRKTTRINTDLTFNLLGLGFRGKKNYQNYYSFNACQKVDAGIYIPKDVFKMALYGTENVDAPNYFDFKRLGTNISVYTEFAIGFSREIDDKWTAGVNLKYLMGQANISTNIKKFDIEAGIDRWMIDGEGTLNASIPLVNIPVEQSGTIDFDNISVDSLTTSAITKMALTGNWGLGIDLGATYKVIPDLELSLGITDLGFIRWRENITNAALKPGYEYTGIQSGIHNMEAAMDTIVSNLEDVFIATGTKNNYTTMLSTRLNVGAEYSLAQDRLSFGVLSSTLFANKTAFQDVTASVNYRPWHWFSTSLSYSCLNGQFSTIGFGIQLRILAFNMYIAADRIPLTFASSGGDKSYPIPTKLQNANIQMGWVWNFGTKDKDDDKDGVRNKKDQCPSTPLGDIVDKVGCTVDTDKDGVADNKDKCPDTPLGTPVDSVGCTLDDDKDGVVNPNDSCPDTPAGVKVDEKGCPLDTDGDTVTDYKDKCPDTPAEARGTVDADGCPKDTDGDGVSDYKDKCPGTPEEARATVDENGCPKDTDGDGVADFKDKCPGTPVEARGKVDENGCELDSDKDGLPDYKDNCPTVAGPISNKGCPEVKAEVKKIFQQALQGIQFESAKSTIKKQSYAILDKIVKILKDNPDYSVMINGHTDSQGNDEYNQKLSDARANAVMTYLLNKGIEANRMKAQGYGELMPVENNATAAGRYKNRRVEFVVQFERFVKE